jgi:hypothetical protein
LTPTTEFNLRSFDFVPAFFIGSSQRDQTIASLENHTSDQASIVMMFSSFVSTSMQILGF